MTFSLCAVLLSLCFLLKQFFKVIYFESKYISKSSVKFDSMYRFNSIDILWFLNNIELSWIFLQVVVRERLVKNSTLQANKHLLKLDDDVAREWT